MQALRIYITWLWQAAKGVRVSILFCALAGIGQVGFSLAFVYVCKELVDIATGVSGHSLEVYALCLLFCIGSQILLSAVRNRLFCYTDILLKNGLRRRLFSRLLMSNSIGKRRHSGDMLNRLTEDIRVIGGTLSRDLPDVITTGIQFVAAFVFLARMESRLAWLIVVVFPICLLLSKLFAGKMRRLTLAIRKSDSHVQAHVQESLQHGVLVQTLEKEDWVARRLEQFQADLYQGVMRRSRFSIFSRAMISTAFSLGYAIAFLWGVNGIREGTITFGMMTAFLQLVGMIQRPIADMGGLLSSFVYATASVDRLRELETDGDQPLTIPHRLNGKVGLRLEQVAFAYPDGKRMILDGFSYDFKPGSRTAILGETGAGKTTLFRLILALISPRSGSITLYNQEESVPLSIDTRCNLVYVPQGNSLWSGTIRENLLLGNPQATEVEMRRVLQVAAADFVFELPEGLDTVCAEQGGGLSEGQAQRIAIARSLLHRGAILLFDEFSSSLDEDTEERLMRNLVTELPKRTMLFITHRHRIVAYCDRVLTIHRLKNAITDKPINS